MYMLYRTCAQHPALELGLCMLEICDNFPYFRVSNSGVERDDVEWQWQQKRKYKGL